MTPCAVNWNAGWLIWITGLLLIAFGNSHANDDDLTLQVLKVTPHFGADRGGIKVGDILTGWSPNDLARDAGSPKYAFAGAMDIFELEREHHPLTGVTLHGLRDGQPDLGRQHAEQHAEWQHDDDEGQAARDPEPEGRTA